MLCCGAFSNDSSSELSDFKVWFSMAPLCSQWGLDAPLLLIHYFPIMEGAQSRFGVSKFAFPQSWFLEVFSTYRKALLLFAVRGYLGCNIKVIDMLCTRTKKQVRSVWAHSVVLTDCGQVGWHCLGSSHGHMPERRHGGTESYPSLTFSAEGAKLCEL